MHTNRRIQPSARFPVPAPAAWLEVKQHWHGVFCIASCMNIMRRYLDDDVTVQELTLLYRLSWLFNSVGSDQCSSWKSLHRWYYPACHFDRSIEHIHVHSLLTLLVLEQWITQTMAQINQSWKAFGQRRTHLALYIKKQKCMRGDEKSTRRHACWSSYSSYCFGDAGGGGRGTDLTKTLNQLRLTWLVRKLCSSTTQLRYNNQRAYPCSHIHIIRT